MRVLATVIGLFFLCTPWAHAKLSGGAVPTDAAADEMQQVADAEDTDTDDDEAAERLRVVTAEKALEEHTDSRTDALVCRKERREGSRIKRNRCQTAAEWQDEYETRMMRSHLIKLAGKAPAWRTP